MRALTIACFDPFNSRWPDVRQRLKVFSGGGWCPSVNNLLQRGGWCPRRRSDHHAARPVNMD